jgi:Leucine carboxyl methyltransferase
MPPCSSRFDTELEAALRRAGDGGDAGSGKRRKQVVVLGAGMDTRPWRHDFLRGAEAGDLHSVQHSVTRGCACGTPPCSAHHVGRHLASCCVQAERGRCLMPHDLSAAQWAAKFDAAVSEARPQNNVPGVSRLPAQQSCCVLSVAIVNGDHAAQTLTCCLVGVVS